MTEESCQQARKVMQSANYIRGKMTKAKGEVAKWTNIEDSHRREMRPGQADGAKKMLERAIGKLDKIRQQFADLKFPAENLPTPKVEKAQCEGCGATVAKGNNYCGECLCEDDSDYL
jgi:hypothetical protein